MINIISHQFIRPIFYINDTDYASKIIETIEANNIIYLTTDRLKQSADDAETIIDVLFTNRETSIDKALKNCSHLILIIKNNLAENKASNVLALEYLFRFNELFILYRYFDIVVFCSLF